MALNGCIDNDKEFVMKIRIRAVAGMVALGRIVLLGGCVAYPAGGSYDPGYGYGSSYSGSYGGGYGYGGDPYYSNPVVVAPSVYVQGGRSYDHGYYDRRPDYRPGYDGRPPRGPNVGRPSRPDTPQRPPSVRPRPERPSSSSLPPRSPNAPPVVQPNGQYIN